MATIAVGDIHGNLEALTHILDQIHGEGGRGDTIVFLGDYIDRGPDTRGCVDAILGFQRDVEAEVVCLLGNHEDWLLRTMRDYTRHSWLLGMEALDTIRSYSVEAARTLSEAAANARVEEQTREAVIWGAGNFPDGYEGAALVVYGHWNNAALHADGWPVPTMVGRTIGIDTISHGVLTAIRLPDRRIFQSARYET